MTSTKYTTRYVTCPESKRPSRCPQIRRGVTELARHLARDHGYPNWLAWQEARDWYRLPTERTSRND